MSGYKSRIFGIVATSVFVGTTFLLPTFAEETFRSESTDVDFTVHLNEVLSVSSSTSDVVINTNPGEFNSNSTVITASTNKPNGYTLTMSAIGASTSLEMTTPKTDAIFSITEPLTSDNFPETGGWGYQLDDAANFDVIPPVTAPIELAATESPSTDEYTVTFGAKPSIGNLGGEYKNTIVFSVTANPGPFTPPETMQEMTPEICTEWPMEESYQLKDTRDNKLYWVTKLADNNCWMTQNLDLDLSTNPEHALTPEDSDVSSNWNAGHDTETVATNVSTRTETYSWSLGDYEYDGSTSNTCGASAKSFEDCYDNDDDHTYGVIASISPSNPAAIGQEHMHRHMGNHYQWNAATAGTGGTITNQEAPSSICPKGWRLPTSGSDGGEFQTLADSGPGTSTVKNWIDQPYYYVRSGFVMGGTLQVVGFRGYWWASTAYTSNVYAYRLYLGGTKNIGPAEMTERNVGQTVRCIARKVNN